MPTQITGANLRKIIDDPKAYRHKAYDETVRIMNRLKVHADGIMPEAIIRKRRPSESEDLFKYRCDIYEPMTSGIFSLILGAQMKILKSPDWNIGFNDEDVPAVIAERKDETLKHYMETKFPYFNNFATWLFNVCLRNYDIDSNAIVLVMPLELNIPENGFYRPFPFIYTSEKVLDYVQDDYVIVQSSDKGIYKDLNGRVQKDGTVYYTADTEKISRWTHGTSSGKLFLDWEFSHNIGMLPAFKLGGQFLMAMDSTYIFKSILDCIVPDANELVREYSDLQAEVMLHTHSEKMVAQTQACPMCETSGRVPCEENASGWEICTTCKGSRYLSTSPYGVHLITPTGIGEPSFALNPPIQYVQKDTGIVTIQDKRIEDRRKKILSHHGLEFLVEIPTGASGVSKALDQDNAYTFFHSTGEGLVFVADRIMFITNEMRYMVAVPDKEQRRKQLPKINVPDRFDILPVSYLIDEVGKAKTSDVNPVIRRAMELDIAGKRFTANPEVKTELELVINLDPLYGDSLDQKIQKLSNGGLEKSDFIISCNINQFIKRALFEDKEFANLPVDKQLQILKKYADEKEKSMSAAEKVKQMVALGDPNVDPITGDPIKKVA